MIRLVGALALILSPALAAAQGAELHGESSAFAAPGIALVWGVLRGAPEDETQVVIRIAVRGEAYAYLAVDAVDPFSQARRVVRPPGPAASLVEVRSPRSTFADFPRREIRLYRTADDARAGRAMLTVYYLGVPDTTPELTSEAALQSYLASALAKLR